jgi:hypothetical protein
MTLEELKKEAPYLTELQGQPCDGGEIIDPAIATRRISRYKRTKIESRDDCGLRNQTEWVCFNFDKLKSWLLSLEGNCNEIRIYIVQIEENDPRPGERLKFNLVLWPFNNGNVAIDDVDTIIQPFNVGNRQPIDV